MHFYFEFINMKIRKRDNFAQYHVFFLVNQTFYNFLTSSKKCPTANYGNLVQAIENIKRPLHYENKKKKTFFFYLG